MEHPQIQSFLEGAVKEGIFPGASYAVARGAERWQGAVGRSTYCPDSPAASLPTVWDLASVSKVVSTTTLAMLAEEVGALDLDQKVMEVFPAFGIAGKEEITFRDLLLHCSGLAAFRPYHQRFTQAEEVLEAIFAEEPQYERGAKTVYSDLGMVTLGKALERMLGASLPDLFASKVAKPLGLTALYTPSPELAGRCAPTEVVEDWRAKLWSLRGSSPRESVQADGVRLIQGEVHDPTCTVLNGVAGHAGLFADAPSLAKFAEALMGGRIVKKETLARWTVRQGLSSRALGWDTNWKQEASAGSGWPETAFGHTGYTGTSIWLLPSQDAYAVLLTNRVCPTAANTKIIGFRPKFHALVAKILGIVATE